MSITKRIGVMLLCTGVIWVMSGCLNDKGNPGSSETENLSDIDNDGIPDIYDDDIDGDGIPNTEDDDIDGDGIPNIEDDDIDGDGIPNIDDNDIDGDGIPNTEDDDIDGDGIPNIEDDDIDGDGIPNADDNDIDGDGIPNTEDDDIDGDGIPNDQDTTPGGTGSDIDGTQGDTNTGPDRNEGETGDDDYVSGIAVVATDTLDFSFEVSSELSGTKITENESVSLQDIRDEVSENGIALSTVEVMDLKVKAVQNSALIQDNRNARVVIKVYYNEGAGQVKMLETAATEGLAGPVVTAGSLLEGLDLNEEIFGSNPGFSNFLKLIKDESKSNVTVTAEIELLDDITLSSNDLTLQLLLTTGGKKQL
ncbi:MAG: hypothetical protein ACLFVQ_07865 [Chitinispirillaceae bacterium]